MPIQVRCTVCKKTYPVADNDAGRQIVCPSCGCLVDVPGLGPSVPPAPPRPPVAAPPRLDRPAVPLRPPVAPPRPPVTAAPGVPPAAAPAAVAPAILTHIKVIGVLNIIAGVMSVLWGLLCLIEIAMAFGLALDVLPPDVAADFGRGDDSPVLMAGIRLLKRPKGSRKLGLAAGFAGAFSVWGCCVWPVGLGVGIYTLVILFGQAAKNFLDSRERG